MKRLPQLLSLILITSQVLAQSALDPTLLSEINQIKAIDNHAHPMSADPNDKEFDALACASLEYVSPPPLRLRIDNPIYTDAWEALFGFKFNTQLKWEENAKQVLTIKQRVMTEQGDRYPTSILVKLNIETMFANRPAIARGLMSPHFRWVGYGDPLMLPLSTKTLANTDADKRFFYTREELLLRRTMETLAVKQLPPSLDLYLLRVVKPAIERQKRDGAVAIKFVAAYMRPLSFDNVSRPTASSIYARYINGMDPPWTEYKQLQDFLFRYIAIEAEHVGLPVHIHTGGGCGHYFNLSNANPSLLESVLNDPSLRKTTFVLVHGGYPFVRETEFLLEKPNVYADFSAQTFLLTPSALARVIRSWLEYEPEKVLFGTDASPSTPEVSWEESAWTTNKNAREALAIALSGMIKDGDITRERALELARMVMRDNAKKLYGL